eukprot:1147675-Pelagomonas_calceolata.AAC.14
MRQCVQIDAQPGIPCTHQISQHGLDGSACVIDNPGLLPATPTHSPSTHRATQEVEAQHMGSKCASTCVLLSAFLCSLHRAAFHNSITHNTVRSFAYSFGSALRQY